MDELIARGTIFDNSDANKNRIIIDNAFLCFIRQNFQFLRGNMQHWKLSFLLLPQAKVCNYFSDYYKINSALFFKILLDFIQSKGKKATKEDLVPIATMPEGTFLHCVAALHVFAIDVLGNKINKACFKIINYKNEG